MEETFIVHQVLKSGVKGYNPFIPDFPAAGPHLPVWHALCETFKTTKTVFAGSVEQFVRLGVEANLKEGELRDGFDDLKRYGMLIISGDVFTPTPLMLGYFFPRSS